jgi:RimJ/RimL family protein N-acetyltransferase
MIETPRLILRPWRGGDRAPYAAMMADPEVGYWLGATLSAPEADAQVDRFIAAAGGREPGFLAVERRADGAFLGAACLRAVVGEAHPMAGTVEIGWRLARAAWGAGHATEAAAALAAYGFDRLDLEAIVAFTTVSNARSRAVMERLGMTRRPELDFDHPALAEDHPLRAHVVYAIARSDWTMAGIRPA